MQGGMKEGNAGLLRRNLTEISLDSALGLSREGDALRAEVLALSPEGRAGLEAAVEELLKEHDEETNALAARLLPGLLGSVMRTLRGGEEKS